MVSEASVFVGLPVKKHLRGRLQVPYPNPKHVCIQDSGGGIIWGKHVGGVPGYECNMCPCSPQADYFPGTKGLGKTNETKKWNCGDPW